MRLTGLRKSWRIWILLVVCGAGMLAMPAWAVPLTGINLTATPPSPGAVGQPITIAAQPTGGVNPLYQFWVGDPQMINWTILQDYSATPTVTWTPTDAGTYPLVIRVKESTSNNLFDYQNDLFYTVTSTALSGVSLAASPPPPQPPNTPITLTATPSGGIAVEYRFTATPSTGTATVVQDYAASPVCTWTPTVADTYTLQVWARETGTQQDPQITAQSSYTVGTNIAPLTGVNVVMTPSAAGTVNQPSTVTGQAIGGVSLLYQFWVGDPTATYWTLLQDYDTPSAISWTPTAVGTFPLVVRVKEASSPNLFDQENYCFYPVNAGTGITSVALSPSPPSPQPVNTPVTLTASATGTGTIQYLFQTTNSAGATTVLQDYATTPTCTWTPSVADTYTVQVLARVQGQAQQPGDQASVSYTVTPVSQHFTVSLTATPTAVNILQPVTLTAQQTGGSNVQYQFWLGTVNGSTVTWTALEPDYQAAASVTWTPYAAGTYNCKVDARAGGQVVESNTITVTANALNGTSGIGPLSITPYAENKVAAVSFTFDDGYQSQLDYAVPLLNTYHFKGTFNVIASFTRDLDSDPPLPTMQGITVGSWESWSRIAAQGHEIGNHSYSHPDIALLTDPNQIDLEINGSEAISAAKIGIAPFTFAFPYNHDTPTLDLIVLQLHYVVRQNESPYGNGLYTAADMNNALDTAIQGGQWLVPQMHGFLPGEYGQVAPSILNAHLGYVQSRAASVWVDTYGHVSRYLQERSQAGIGLDISQSQLVQFELTCSLDPTVFNIPLTVLITTGQPSVSSATAKLVASGTVLPTTIQPGGLILVDVLPGSGAVAVTWK